MFFSHPKKTNHNPRTAAISAKYYDHCWGAAIQAPQDACATNTRRLYTRHRYRAQLGRSPLDNYIDVGLVASLGNLSCTARLRPIQSCPKSPGVLCFEQPILSQMYGSNSRMRKGQLSSSTQITGDTSLIACEHISYCAGTRPRG